MPVGGKKQSPVVVELEEATVISKVSGREWDVSGAWNRMFQPRVLSDYSYSGGLGKVAQLDGGETLEYCYGCGKCVPVCPVDLVSEYGPRKIHRKVQTGLDLFASDELWMCTTCGNCLRVCPKGVNMIQIMPAVREVAVGDGKVPDELQGIFEKTFRYGNALGENPRRRHAWTKAAGVPVRVLGSDPTPVDVLFYVEDYWSYHPRGQQAAQAFARTMARVGVDFAILGAEEKTVGDSQRLAGEKGLFDALVEDVTSTLAKYEFNRIVTPDPHAFNALVKEYPKRGFTYDVLHYTQLLSPLIDRMNFVNPINKKVTFHDPCYLGRHNGEYDAPRKLLKAIPGLDLVEMGRCKENSYCCGGGGGGMWLDGFNSNHVSERLSERRVREAAGTGAEILAVCCPYEVSRFEDAAKSTGNEHLKVMDIAELLDEALGGSEGL
ncbi:Fe-S oxidoreductase [Ferrithrix thermotolerans DSM 19514]|jgi:Fe-S oxidoreductase|uniref:Fe-S oxidoreductase n=1 Tax=Ferrithrix thermotolerans DSM 19514 TaxID=1121881 RepID=A0A1M4WRK4_9ACTN|nr:(Fe-S)-binding protein [Ferrithrix thermotolerans]SHE83612.1 Fe-S oxidoreductase [Ferrithrix thermotolerans DSM 19514]